jgi:hypothetical protein
MKTSNIILWVILIGAGMLLCRVLFPPPDYGLPEPELIPGDTVVVYRDTTIYETVETIIPVEVEVTPERNIISVDEDVSLFAGKVTFKIVSRDVELEGIRIRDAKLHLQQVEITITDTLRVPYPVPIERGWYDTRTTWMTVGVIFTVILLWIIN